MFSWIKGGGWSLHWALWAKVPNFGLPKTVLSVEWKSQDFFILPKMLKLLLNWVICTIQWIFGPFPVFAFLEVVLSEHIGFLEEATKASSIGIQKMPPPYLGTASPGGECFPLILLLWVGVNNGCWHPVLTPTNMSRHTGRCQHWVLAPSVNTYQYV